MVGLCIRKITSQKQFIAWKKKKKTTKKYFFLTDYQLSLKIQNTFIDKTNH